MAEFSWAAAADVGLGLVGGLGKGLNSLGAKALSEANADAANTVREAQNGVRRSQRDLAATIRGINNKRVMEGASTQLDALHTASLRTNDAIARGDFEASVQHAERWGAAASAGAASGIGGSSIDAISQTTALAIAREDQNRKAQGADVLFDIGNRGKNVMSNALGSLDFGPLGAGNDLQKNTSTTQSSLMSSLLAGLLSKKDSLQTMLGSIPGDDKPGVQPGSNWISDGQDASQQTDPGKASFSFADAVTSPVSQSTVQGQPLQPWQAVQADVKKFDNTFTLN